MATNPDSEYLTIAEACARLGVSRVQMQRLLRRYRLDYLLRVPEGREVRLRWSDIAGLAEGQEGEAPKTA